MSTAKCRTLDAIGPTDPVHSKMPKILAGRIPGDQIPKRRQDQHRLRLDKPPGLNPFRVTIPKPQVLAFEKCRLKCRQHRGVDLSQIGYVDLRCERTNIQTIQETAQIAELVRRQRLLDFRESFVCQAREGQVSSSAHARHTDYERKDFGYRQTCRGLYGLRIQVQSASPARLGMNDKPFIPQRGDVAEYRATRCAHVSRQRINRCGSVAAQAAHNGILSGTHIHIRSRRNKVSDFGTFQS